MRLGVYYTREGPYILPLWNDVAKDHPIMVSGDLIPKIVYMDPRWMRGFSAPGLRS